MAQVHATLGIRAPAKRRARPQGARAGIWGIRGKNPGHVGIGRDLGHSGGRGDEGGTGERRCEAAVLRVRPGRDVRPQSACHLPKLLEGGLQVLDDLGREHRGRGQADTSSAHLFCQFRVDQKRAITKSNALRPIS
jgi:hypothetical protein